MRYMPEALAVLSLPAGAVGYIVTAQVLGRLSLGDGVGDVLMLFVPLFVAGLVMLPFLIPYFDRKAKQDLEVIRQRKAAEAAEHPEAAAQPDDPEGPGR